MPNSFIIERLQSRRLLYNITLDVDESVSTFDVEAGIDLGDPGAIALGGVTAVATGTIDISVTRRGIKFLSADIKPLIDGQPADTVVFENDGTGIDADVSGLAFDVTSRRLPLRYQQFDGNKLRYSTQAIDVSRPGFVVDDIPAFTQVHTDDGIGGPDRQPTRRRPDGSFLLVFSLDLINAETVFTQNSQSHTLSLSSQSFIRARFAPGFAPQSLQLASAPAGDDPNRARTRVVTDILEGV